MLGVRVGSGGGWGVEEVGGWEDGVGCVFGCEKVFNSFVEFCFMNNVV